MCRSAPFISSVLAASLTVISPCVLSGASPTQQSIETQARPSAGTVKRLAVQGPVFVEYDRLARLARDGGKAELEALVSAYLLRSVVAAGDSTVQARVVRAEQAFRNGKQPPVSEARIAAAFNGLVSSLNLPSFLRTNGAQIGLVRSTIEDRAPFLGIVSSADEEPDTKNLSPVEAVFLLTFLATQKAYLGAYQADADTWVDRTRSYRAAALRSPGGIRAETYPIRWTMPAVARAVLSEPSSTIVTSRLHAVLDDIGLQH